MIDLTVHPMTHSQLDDWLGFFDTDAFADNTGWGGCYCRCYLFGGSGREAWAKACANGSNRQAMIDAFDNGEVDGLLARRQGSVVGWVHFGPSGRFYSPMSALTPVESGLASIVCFVVSAPHRRTGVARALLRGVCDELEKRGFSAVDARPQVDPGRNAADQYSGPLSMFLAEGFEVVERSDSSARVVCQLETRPVLRTE